MLYRLSASVLLKSVIAVMAVAIVLMLGGNAWHSWRQFASASRIADIADAPGYTFNAIHNLRTDRTLAGRALDGEQPADPSALTRIEKLPAAALAPLVPKPSILPEANVPGTRRLSQPRPTLAPPAARPNGQ